MLEGWIRLRIGGGRRRLKFPGSQTGGEDMVISGTRLFGMDLMPRNVTQSDVTMIV